MRTSEEDLRVVVAGDVVGEVRVDERDGDLVVLAARLVSPGHAAVLTTLLDCRALASDARAVVLAGDAGSLGDLVAGGGWEVASQRLRLDLASVPSAASDVRLLPMGQEAFAAYQDGLSDAERLLLPDGVDSPDQHLFTGWVGDRVVGHVWLGTERAETHVRSLDVVEEERRRGHGAGVARAAALWARERGADHLGAHVLGPDTPARALGAALGSDVVDTTYRRAVPR